MTIKVFSEKNHFHLFRAFTYFALSDLGRVGRKLKSLLHFLKTFLYYATLIYDLLSSFRLYYIQFKEVKFYGGRGPEAGGRITLTVIQFKEVKILRGLRAEDWGSGARSRVPDNPNT